jgi:hypothetical protein
MRHAYCLALVALLPACHVSRTTSPGDDGGGGDFAVGPPATRDIVSPPLSSSIVGAFDSATPGTGALTIAYPNPGVIIPHDLAAMEPQWNAGAAQNVFRVTFAVDTGDRLRGYVGTASWLPDASDWQWLLDRAQGHSTTLTVEGGTLDSMGDLSGVVASAPQMLHVSHDDASGAIYYFATIGDQITGQGTLDRLALGGTVPDQYLNATNDGGRCVGCHALSRDGTHLAFAFDVAIDVLQPLSLGLVAATDPTTQMTAANNPASQATFNPDGSRLVTSYQGKLTLRDGSTGAQLADIATSGLAFYPDWSPDGKHIVFVRPSSTCVPAPADFGQSSIYVYGGSLVTMDVSGDSFSNETVIVPVMANNNYYPVYSPDGGYIAFTRNDGTSLSSSPVANTSCAGATGAGISYDNPSATLWVLPTAGGAPIALTAANETGALTNSWPKWGPKTDGEYLWLALSSTRPYGNTLTGANAHHQIWISAIQHASAGAVDPSAPVAWFPFQTESTKNHIASWSIQVGSYAIQ